MSSKTKNKKLISLHHPPANTHRIHNKNKNKNNNTDYFQHTKSKQKKL